jgi:hypothetical protein
MHCSLIWSHKLKHLSKVYFKKNVFLNDCLENWTWTGFDFRSNFIFVQNSIRYLACRMTKELIKQFSFKGDLQTSNRISIQPKITIDFTPCLLSHVLTECIIACSRFTSQGFTKTQSYIKVQTITLDKVKVYWFCV